MRRIFTDGVTDSSAGIEWTDLNVSRAWILVCVVVAPKNEAVAPLTLMYGV